uniref:F-box domain-containing protein n=1 Tax=Panagrolaimus sp. JU765 TaxID=591449 RepID=A0AC34RTN4_9BILA
MSCKMLSLDPDFEYFKKNPIINYKFVPVDLEFDYEQGKSETESIFEQFASIPTTVLTRFIELLPSKSLRLFSFASKFHYIQCLRIRGIEIERFIYSSISEKPGNTCLTANGTVIYNYRSNFHHPIITFFNVIGVVGVDCCDIGNPTHIFKKCKIFSLPTYFIDTQFDKYMYNLKLLIHENVERAEFRMIL